MTNMPADDQPDVIYVGPVGSIPVFHEDDPRLDEERASWSAANTVAQGMISADELLAGVDHSNWRVRHRVIDRLVARAGDDRRTLPALIGVIRADPVWQVRDAAVMALRWSDDDRVRQVLVEALHDPHSEVRWSAQYKLSRFGQSPPGDSS